MDLQTILLNLSQTRSVFHNEADFQHALAWGIREHYPDAKIRLEMKVRGSKTKMYLDIMVSIAGRKYAIELKYKTRPFQHEIDREEFSLSNHGAQDTGRYDVLKDIQRLEQMVATKVVDEGILVFLTNDVSYCTDPGEEKQTADRDFRLHEGRTLNGVLSWGEQTGQGTMKGREEPLTLLGRYDCHWCTYSHLSDSNGGEFQYLLLPVRNVQPTAARWKEPNDISNNKESEPREVTVPEKAHQNVRAHSSVQWFDSFVQRKEIPLSQADLRDRLAGHLREVGYLVSTNRNLGQEKIDIWAEQGNDVIAIEVRNKTALLQTVYKGQLIHLKNQAAQDISRYDFINDIGKLERVGKTRPMTKRYALLLTNDPLYWNASKRIGTADEKFHVYDSRVLTGTCSWSEQASPGTTSGREQQIELEGTYHLKWLPYVNLGDGKNQQFQMLLVEIQ